MSGGARRRARRGCARGRGAAPAAADASAVDSRSPRSCATVVAGVVAIRAAATASGRSSSSASRTEHGRQLAGARATRTARCSPTSASGSASTIPSPASAGRARPTSSRTAPSSTTRTAGSRRARARVPVARAPLGRPERVHPGARRPRRARGSLLWLAVFAAGVWLGFSGAARRRSSARCGCSSRWASGRRRARRRDPARRADVARARAGGRSVTELARRGTPRPAAASMPTYAVRAPLARWLRARPSRAHARPAAATACSTSAAARSRTCPFFAPSPPSTSASTRSRTRRPSCRGRSRRCPSRTRRFDVVLCTQVLEHCDDPAQAVRELRRVTAPGGRVLASTHGVLVYHPSPVDLLALDARRASSGCSATNGDWALALRWRRRSGTTACLGMLVAIYLDLASRPRLRRASAAPARRGDQQRRARRSTGASPSLREPARDALRELPRRRRGRA